MAEDISRARASLLVVSQVYPGAVSVGTKRLDHTLPQLPQETREAAKAKSLRIAMYCTNHTCQCCCRKL